MNEELRKEIERLLRSYTDSDIVAATIFINCEGMTVDIQNRHDGELGASWRNLRGDWVP